jgi:hypothetical protein
MGTNYYAVKMMTAEDKDLAKELIDNDYYDTLIDLINEKCVRIHIGKACYGWKFLFNYNMGKFYNATKHDLNDFLSQRDIIDEYGKKVSLEAFWRIVERHKDGLDNKEYFSKNESHFILGETEMPTYLLKFSPSYHEFYHDGLRFSIFTDFE